MPDLLYEIGAEEIPAGYIASALEQLERSLMRELEAARLTYDAARSAATPRRLVVAVKDVIARQPDAEEEVLGPSAKVAFAPDGTPTKAAIGFARSLGVELSAIARKQTPRGEYCCVRRTLKGRPALDVLAEILPRITLEISFPKSMVWLPERRAFARPVRSLVALLGKEIIPFTLFDVASGRSTESHPILRPGRFDLPDADFDRYKEMLREHQVIVEFSERQKMICDEIERQLGQSNSEFREEVWRLLNEVTNLVQYPMVLTGHFDPAFLSVPAPVVEAAMMEHQRYFPVRDAAGELQPHFIVVSDRTPEHAELIRKGNEQVLKARLSDAQFFDEQDRKHKLEERVEALKGVAFLKGLGSYYDKTLRLEKLALKTGEALGLDASSAARAVRAAHLCKADLLTEMVGEFPVLQGKIGRIYAAREREPEEVAAAIEEHYLPRSADGELPATPVGKALSLAEKLDNMAGCFALGLLPTGSADPYALRRQSQGALRIIEESEQHFSLTKLLEAAVALLPMPHSASAETVPKLMEFLRDRLTQMALDRGAPQDLINATLTSGFDDVCDFWARLDTLRMLSLESVWQKLVIAVERTYNISKSAPADLQLNPALFKEDSEKELGTLLAAHEEEILELENKGDYSKASRRYAEVFAAPLHEFFDKVFVNVDDERLRNNRLELMRRINRLYSARIADLSQITTGVQK